MRALCWSCVLGLLCAPAWVIAITVTVTQTPSSISVTKVNSSVTITCSTSLSAPMGLSLKRQFGSQRDVVFLALNGGKIAKITEAPQIKGRVEIKEEARSGTGLGFTFTLSLLQEDDTDLYYCSCTYFASTLQRQSSNGSTIIVKERIPESTETQCDDHILDIISLVLSITAIPFVICLLLVAVLGVCKHFKKKFTPSRPVNNMPQRRSQHRSQHRPQYRPQYRPQHICTQHSSQTYSYLSTSVSSSYSQENVY